MIKTEDIHIRKAGPTGRITLTRPDALNAMTYEMCMAIGEALDAWRDDPSVRILVIDAEGSRSFCSGGDIAELYATGTAGDYAYGRKFWADEYRINAKVREYPKPYVAIMDGIVMGGGVGISAHGSHRVVTENTLFAMPECAIGLVPDVGGSLLLAHAPGHIGEYLGTTGARIKAGDCIFAGVADIFVPEANLAELIDALEDTADLSFLDTFAQDIEPEMLAEQQSDINRHFVLPTALNVIQSLEKETQDWAVKAAKLMRRNCPLSVACAIEIIRLARAAGSIEEVLELEYRFTYRSMSHGDFLEGTRAQIVDKDRNPRWRYPTLESLSSSQIDQMLVPLEDTVF
ncbi:MAG: enoyl-CoA hydratase/isomerase family protein [Pseudomonadota bacterium]